jgi:hypothetical protein
MRIHGVILLCVVALAGGVAAAQGSQAAVACSRECLVTTAEQYIDALVAKDPEPLPLTPGARHTE